MFERYTDRARRVVVLAQEEARGRNHNYLGTEHLLLGLLHEGGGVAAQALRNLDVPLEVVRAQVEAAIGAGQEEPPGHIAFTPRAKAVMELSLREALQLGHAYVGTEHLLLGLLREGEGVGAQVLIARGANLAELRHEVVRLARDRQPAPSPGPRPGDGMTEVLARLGRVEHALAEVRDQLHDILARLPPPDEADRPAPGGPGRPPPP